MILRTARFADLDATTLYALLKLRTDVFVVEQACAYPELDGRDAEPGAQHRWFEDEAGSPLAYLRTLVESDGAIRIGRVVTRPGARGTGLARQLVEGVLVDHPGPVVADAQAHLVGWYEALGFVINGPEYLEDDIAHVPMRRDARGRAERRG
jgi:ElaA protein